MGEMFFVSNIPHAAHRRLAMFEVLNVDAVHLSGKRSPRVRADFSHRGRRGVGSETRRRELRTHTRGIQRRSAGHRRLHPVRPARHGRRGLRYTRAVLLSHFEGSLLSNSAGGDRDAPHDSGVPVVIGSVGRCKDAAATLRKPPDHHATSNSSQLDIEDCKVEATGSAEVAILDVGADRGKVLGE